MMRSYKKLDDFAKTRSARFQLHPETDLNEFDGIFKEETLTGFDTFLEQLMNELPGKLNVYFLNMLIFL